MADKNYSYHGTFYLPSFNSAFIEKFGKNPRYNVGALNDLSTLLVMIGNDQQMTDIRWAAYMLATVFWETTTPHTIEVPKRDKFGKPVMKDGQPVVLKQKKWMMTMAPVDEVGGGKGRRYHEAVKVAPQPDGSVVVTEQDGDRFSVSAQGKIKPLNKTAVMGTTDGGAATATYTKADGAEHAYFGRGYVQLTWWSNYATTGVAIGRGLDLLTDPELVKDPKIAYAVMAHGMRTGDGFANGHKFTQYFRGKLKDYRGARRMVNGTDHAEEIAKIAQKFEDVLMDARFPPLTPEPFAPELAGAPGFGGFR